MRAFQLLDFAKQSANPPVAKVAKKTKASASKSKNGDNKQIIISCVEDLINRGRIDSAMLANLCDLGYTRAIFHVSSFPFFQEANAIRTDDQNRYYPQLFFPANNGVAYRVTNQWHANKNLQYFNNWYKSVK